MWVVGGLSIGGAGRTPVVAYLAQRLWSEGRRIAVVGHGYGGRGQHVRLAGGAVEIDGDEACALRALLPSALPIYLGPRSRAIAAAQRAGAEIVVVDGGMQDPSLPSTRVIAVIDATDGQEVMPSGPLREGWAALSRADVVWQHRVDEPGACPLPAPWRAHLKSCVQARTVRLPDGAVVPASWLSGRVVVPIVGIGRPTSFFNTLDRLGARRSPGLVRADHHHFQAREARHLTEGLWITTTKDLPRIPHGWPVAVLTVELVLSDRSALDVLWAELS